MESGYSFTELADMQLVVSAIDAVRSYGEIPYQRVQVVVLSLLLPDDSERQEQFMECNWVLAYT
jgi:hypothetical protein